ncbi:MAG: hypothetical protein NC307_07905 [Roseburia sp.]|nr:hypothetical protein [Roseburia sp.]
MESQRAILIVDATENIGKENSLMAAVGQALKEGASGGGGTGEKTFVVQYNPTSLKFQGNAPQTDETQGAQGTQIPGTGSVSMSVDLVFHAIAPGDSSAFHKVETMLHTIQASAAKRVKFCWGKMIVEGELTGFSGNYDMFDSTGMPISGSVSLSIRVKAKTATVEKRMEEMAKA